MLSLTHLAVDHGKLRALWDVSMNVGRGERVGLLGANGAGKSTAMGAIVGLYAAASGGIEFDGSPLVRASTSQTVGRGIALVPTGEPVSDVTLSEPGRALERLRGRWALSVHGVGLSIGAPGPLDGASRSGRR